MFEVKEFLCNINICYEKILHVFKENFHHKETNFYGY